MFFVALALALALALVLLPAALAGDNGLALVPPRTWRSWNAFGWQISAETMRVAARGLVDGSRAIRGRPAGSSLLDLGFDSVGMDEGWQACAPQPGFPTGDWMFHRSNADGSIAPVVNETLFGDMKGLVEEIHALGLQAGWYLNPCFSYCWKLGDTCGDECNSGDVEAALACECHKHSSQLLRKCAPLTINCNLVAPNPHELTHRWLRQR
jgi:hypothetical protein